MPDTTCIRARTTRSPNDAPGRVAGPIIERRPNAIETPIRILLGRVASRFRTSAKSAAATAGTMLATITGPMPSAETAAAVTFGERFLGPIIDAYLRGHSGVEVEVLLADRYVDIVHVSVRGRLVEVLSSFALPPTPFYIVYAGGPHTPPRLRAFIDVATEQLRGVI